MKLGNDPWGGRAQIGGTLKELDDLKGNRDGIWDNESGPSGSGVGFSDSSPLLTKTSSWFSVGLSPKEEVRRLKMFLDTAEAEWGEPVIDPTVRAELDHGDLFAVQKAIALKRMGRPPHTVVDGFVNASGSVNGEAIAPRRIFTQRFEPTGAPSGDVVVVAPGYLETGRTFYEMIAAWNAAGHTVVVMDQQWAGQSEGTPGGIDRGFGVSRDVAAVTADTAAWAKQNLGADSHVLLFGNSMGAGPGVLGAHVMNLNGRMQLDGPPMPKDLRLVLMAPFLSATPSLLNKTVHAVAAVPLANHLQPPVIDGLPQLTEDPVQGRHLAQGSTMEDVRAQLSAFRASDADLAVIKKLVEEGVPITQPISIVHAAEDALADTAGPTWLRDRLGADVVTLKLLPGRNHILAQSPSEQGYGIDAVNAMLKR